MTNEEELGLAARSCTLGAVFLLRAERLEAFGCLASGALVQLGISVTELNCDVSEALFVVAHSLHFINNMIFDLH